MKIRPSPLLLLPAIALLLSGCESAPTHGHGASPHSGPIPLRAPTLSAAAPEAPEPTRVLDLKTLSSVEAIIPKLAQKRVVFVGEIHDRQEQHDGRKRQQHVHGAMDEAVDEAPKVAGYHAEQRAQGDPEPYGHKADQQ